MSPAKPSWLLAAAAVNMIDSVEECHAAAEAICCARCLAEFACVHLAAVRAAIVAFFHKPVTLSLDMATPLS